MILAIWLPKLDFDKDNLLAMNGLKPGDGGTESGLGASFRTRFSVSLIPKDIPGSFCKF